MDLTFQVPVQYCSLEHRTSLLSPVTATTGCFFFSFFASAPSLHSFWSYFSTSSSILGTYWPGEFIFQCPIFLPFHTVYGVLKTRILKWFAIPFSSWRHFVRTLHRDPFILGGSTQHGLVSLSQTRLWSMWSDWLVFCDCGDLSDCLIFCDCVMILIMEKKWWQEEQILIPC